MIPVRLLNHYRPRSMDYEIIGEPAPPPLPGIASDYKDKDGNVTGVKLWAGTTVKLPRDEVLHLLENEVERTENKVDESGRIVGKRKVKHRFPLAERTLDDLRV